jgi:NAD(P)H-nitrite reductase large subunit
MSEQKPRTYEGDSDIKVENPDMIICRCEEITLREILQAIREGARTINGVKRRTRAGMGLCQGRSCGRLVRKLIAEHTKQKSSDILPGTFRPPVRPISLSTMASLEVGDE